MKLLKAIASFRPSAKRWQSTRLELRHDLLSCHLVELVLFLVHNALLGKYNFFYSHAKIGE